MEINLDPPDKSVLISGTKQELFAFAAQCISAARDGENREGHILLMEGVVNIVVRREDD